MQEEKKEEFFSQSHKQARAVSPFYSFASVGQLQNYQQFLTKIFLPNIFEKNVSSTCY